MKFFLFIVMLVSNIANANEFKHLQSDSYWTVEPSVFVCSDTNININLVQEAIKFWIDNGFNVNNPNNSNGRSREYTYSGQHALLEVEIAIKASLENEIDLLKHELGHALGLDDDTTGSAVVMRHSRMY